MPGLKREQERWKTLERGREGLCVVLKHTGNEEGVCFREDCEEVREAAERFRRSVVGEYP
jgi:hypothetical protein